MSQLNLPYSPGGTPNKTDQDSTGSGSKASKGTDNPGGRQRFHSFSQPQHISKVSFGKLMKMDGRDLGDEVSGTVGQ